MHAAHQFLPAGRDGAAKPDLAIKLDSAQAGRTAGAAALARNLRLCAAKWKACICASAASRAAASAGRDRREDFRTEILGLVKAQQVKNAVIVPVGAKGGFYPKRMPANPTREAVHGRPASPPTRPSSTPCWMSPTIWTADGTVVPPPDVLRHDGDDPYLVVAADKGTATFSDIANGIALERGFWLGDAFASRRQPSAMTTRRWASPRAAPGKRSSAISASWARDIQSEPTSPCIGVGDMSGDVFGNGMLLSQAYQAGGGLRPPPHLPRSRCRCRPPALPSASACSTCRAPAGTITTRALIGKGGGVFARTPEGNSALAGSAGADRQRRRTALSPPALIKALLKAQVDLLWFGGIGTYIKAASQIQSGGRRPRQ